MCACVCVPEGGGGGKGGRDGGREGERKGGSEKGLVTLLYMHVNIDM